MSTDPARLGVPVDLLGEDEFLSHDPHYDGHEKVTTGLWFATTPEALSAIESVIGQAIEDAHAQGLGSGAAARAAMRELGLAILAPDAKETPDA